MQRLLLAALLLAGCGSRTSLGTRDAAPYVDDDPFLKLDGAAGPSVRAGDGGGGGGGPLARDASAPELARASSTARAEAALRDVAKLLWESEPDPGHLELARGGQIQSSADLEKIVREMLKDARSAVGVGKFYRWWLNIDDLHAAEKDPQLFPLFPKAVAPLIEDVVSFGVDATLSDGRFVTLMTGQRPYSDMTLAALVGDRGDDPRRAGLLARPGFLALHAHPDRGSPVSRGFFIRHDVLCDELPPHPMDVDLRLPPQPDGMTNREQYVSVTAAPICKACHGQMDDIGFGFENFDAVGAFRYLDHGRMIDASGVVRDTQRGDVAFNGAVELGKVLATSSDAQSCIVSKWYHYLLGAPAQPGDQLLARAQKAFAAGGGDMRDVIVAVLGAHPL
jgi:hypothetical protein